VTRMGADWWTYHTGGLRSTRRLPRFLGMEWVICIEKKIRGSSLDDVIPGDMADERLM
jgi:hypothetical protein